MSVCTSGELVNVPLCLVIYRETKINQLNMKFFDLTDNCVAFFQIMFLHGNSSSALGLYMVAYNLIMCESAAYIASVGQ